MSDFRTLGEIVQKARQNLSQNVWDYLSGGAESEVSVNRNRQALDSIAFRPRVLRGVAEIDASTSGGSVSCDLPITTQGRMSKSSLRGTIGSGGPLLTLRTSGGSIRISERSI